MKTNKSINSLKNQKGIVFPALLVLIATVGILAFFALSFLSPSGNKLFNLLFQKPFSQAAGLVDLEIVPNDVTVGAGQTFLVDVVLDAKSEKPTAADITIKYDPTVLQGLNIQNGYFFNQDGSGTLIGAPFVNNTVGLASATLTMGPEPIGCATLVKKGLMPEDQCVFNYKSGKATIVTIEFKALKATTPTTALQFDLTNDNTAVAVLNQTGNVLAGATNANITVSANPTFTKTAGFSLTPATQNVATNQEFPVQIKATSPTDNANLFAAKMDFDPTKLQITRIDSTGSFITQWLNNTTFDNTNGKVSIIGGVETAGVKLATPTLVATVYFKGIAAGTGAISFNAGAAIYRDTDAVDILNTRTGSSISIFDSIASPTPVPTTAPTATPNPTPVPTAAPTATPGSSATPAPTSSPAPTASPTAKPSTTPVPTVVASATPPPVTTCTISQASWIVPATSMQEGRVAQVKVTATGNCTGKFANFEIWEDDILPTGLGGSDKSKNNPPRVAFAADNTATSSWLTEFQQDGFFGVGNPPEYYFLAKVEGTAAKVRSTNPLLQVTQLAPGQFFKGDANKDGAITLADFSVLLSNWSKTDINDEADTNDDGVINSADSAAFRLILQAAGALD